MELSNGTGQYFGIINSGGNNNWYCELKNSSTTDNVSSWSCLRIGEWHNITCTHKDGTFRLYVDGQLRRTQSVNVSLPELVARLKVVAVPASRANTATRSISLPAQPSVGMWIAVVAVLVVVFVFRFAQLRRKSA